MSTAATSAVCEEMIGRRTFVRTRLDISARLVGPGSNVRVQLEDISASGASVRLFGPEALSDARVCWLNISHYGRIVWNDGMRCGISFDDQLSEEALRTTVEFAKAATADASRSMMKLASAWVHGPGDY